MERKKKDSLVSIYRCDNNFLIIATPVKHGGLTQTWMDIPIPGSEEYEP